ncbi:MAG: 50S ribosomal protein L4 [Candidatus Aenigmatarchaeota archaeon]
MKVNVFDLKGKPSGQVELPKVFNESIRPDIIKRASLAFQSTLRQPYGTDPMAGLRTSVHYHGRRRVRYAMIMISKARLPRIHGGSPHMSYRVRRVPQAVKGRRAHPPKTMKNWFQKINRKENELAIRSALAATVSIDHVKGRGHIIDGIKNLPIVLKDDIESVKKTKEIKNILINLGLEKELKRVEEKKVRPGKGKRRGRKYKRKVGPIIIVKEDKGIIKAGKNIPGLDVKVVDDLTIRDLSPGAVPGRLAIFSQSAIKSLEEF